MKPDLAKDDDKLATAHLEKPRRNSGLLQDRAGNIWTVYGLSKGICRFDGRSFTRFNENDGLSCDKVWCIFEDSDGKLWFGTGDGVTCFDGKEFTVIPISKIRGDLTYSYAKTKFDSFGMPFPLENSVLSILQDQNGMYWFGTVNGIYCYDGKRFTPFSFNDKLGMKPGCMNNEFMMKDRGGNIWIGGRCMEGIHCFDGKNLRSYMPDGNAWMFPLLEDNSGKIWFGSLSNRVFLSDGNSFINFKEFSGWVYSSEQDRAGNFWFSSGKSGGVTFYDGNSFINYTVKDGLGSNTVSSIIEDQAGNIWFRTENGLSRYDGKNFKNFSE